MLSCAMDSSVAPRAALAAATERPSDVSAAIIEWGTVPQTPNRNYHERPRVEGPRVWVLRTRDKACDRGARVTHAPRVVLGMLAPNSDTKVGVISDGELDGNDCAPVVVEAVQVGAERAVSVVVVVSNRRGSTTIATRVAIRVIVGRGKCRERSFADPSSSRQQAGRSGFEVREDGGDGVVVPQASPIEVAVTRRVRVLGSLEDVALWALAQPSHGKNELVA